MMPGESQFSSKGLISMKEGMGLMKPIEKPLEDISWSLIDCLFTSYSGGNSFLSFWLKSGTTL